MLLALIVGAPSTAPAGAQAASPDPIIGIDEIERGQRGYGLTVFVGTTPERFEVEVIGVMRNTSPDRSWILARLSGQNLEKSGVAQGMSGSPVYIDDRLAGAVAFSWGFAEEPIAGITPIAEMRALGGGAAALVGQPIPNPVASRAPGNISHGPPRVDLAAIAALEIPEDLLLSELARLQPRLLEGATSALQWTATGFSGTGRELLGSALGGLSPSGRMAVATGTTQGSARDDTTDPAPAELAPSLVRGGPVAIVLVEGDLNLAATGTVTDVYGDQILALGHPLLGLGPVTLPMAQAEVLTILPSLNTSFKISNQGPVVGAFEQDREAGMLGRVGAVAPMIPMTITVRGERERSYRLRVAELSGLTPALVATSMLGALQTASYARGEQAIDLRATLHLRGYPPLVVEQSFDGGNAGTQAAGYLLSIAGYLLDNTLEEVEVQEVHVEVDQLAAPRTATLAGAYADRTVVKPGDTVTLNLEFLAYRGEPFRHSLSLQLPPDLPSGRYSLLVGDGPTVDTARLEVEGVVPRRFPQALELLRSFHSQRDLVVLGVYGSRGLAVNGQPMPRLPGSMRALMGSAGSTDAVPLNLAVAQEVVERLDFPFRGGARVDLEVRRREPVVPGAAEGLSSNERSEGEPSSDPSQSQKSNDRSPPRAEDSPGEGR